MNLANRITIGRCCLPVVLIPALMLDLPGAKVLALALFILGIISDAIDGMLARRLGLVNDFGRLMDPLADKILIVSALVCFVAMPPYVVRTWMVVIIIAREFIVTGLRQLALQSNTVMSAETIGKHKTAWQMIAIVALLLYYALADLQAWLPPGMNSFLAEHAPRLLQLLFYVVTLLTLLSGIIYLWRYRALYTRHM
jgi:CDP-diacylglycerol--glycerol-3-phosphate 3-phosphatidyltransferase